MYKVLLLPYQVQILLQYLQQVAVQEVLKIQVIRLELEMVVLVVVMVREQHMVYLVQELQIKDIMVVQIVVQQLSEEVEEVVLVQ